MNNLLYNLRDKWKQRDGSEVLWVSYETFFMQRLNFCNFTFIWERGEFHGKITDFSYRCAKYRKFFNKRLNTKIYMRLGENLY